MLENRLRAARVHKGFSQAGLTQKTGISSSIISAIENGKIFPYPGWRRRLSDALGVDEREIFPMDAGGGE